MDYFIIIRGSLGVGKSTIAKKLSAILHCRHISIDKILEKRGLDKISPEAGCIPLKNYIKADEIIIPQAKRDLEKGRIIVFDACFYNKEHIEHLIKNLEYTYYVFILKASLETCIKRDSKRKRVYGKGAAEAVHMLVSKFDYGIIVDTENRDANQAVKEILSYLPKL